MSNSIFKCFIFDIQAFIIYCVYNNTTVIYNTIRSISMNSKNDSTCRQKLLSTYIIK